MADSVLDAREQAILDAWRGNAAAWTKAVRDGAIASRRLVTDTAMVAAVLSRQPRTVIDLGCGEGWLMRELVERGIDVLGVDAVPALAESAAASGCKTLTLDYASVVAGGLREQADVLVCNFSLIGGASVDALLCAMPALLASQGVAIIQTLHPWSACGDEAYVDGWRAGSWAGCGEGFSDAAPWYFRTMAGWLASFRAAGLRLRDLREPLHPGTGQPASVIFVLGADGARSDLIGHPSVATS